MAQKCLKTSFVAVVLLILIPLPALAQRLFCATPTDSIWPLGQHRKRQTGSRRIDCRGTEEQLEDGHSHRRYRGLSGVF